MSKDPFEINKVGGVGSGSGAGGVDPTAYLNPGTAVNRTNADSTVAPTGGTTSSGVTDKVNLSNDVDDSNPVKDSNIASLISALRPPDQTQTVNPVGNTAQTQAIGATNNYDPGFQAGAVYGPNGSNQPAGMTGTVHNTRGAE